MILDLHHTAQASSQGVLNSMLEGLAIALFAAALLKILGRKNSGTNFAVWFSALLAIVLLPFFSFSPAHPLMGSTSATVTIPDSWAVYLLGAWALITSLALLRMAIGVWHLIVLRRTCKPIDINLLDPSLQTTVRAAQAVRHIEVCSSDRLQVPTAIGFFRPAVVLPQWALQELSTSELNAVLLHELAHLRRWDDWTNLAQKLFRAILFFHPAVWWIESKLNFEREMACDEIVLANTDAKAYAECLVLLAERNYMRRGLAMAQAAVHRAGQTAKRLAQILDVNRPAATFVSKPAVAWVVVFAAGCFAVAPHTPRIVGFSGETPAAAVAAVPSPAPVVASDHAGQLGAKVVKAAFAEEKVSRKRALPKAIHSRNPLREEQNPALLAARTGAPRDASAPSDRSVVPPPATYVVMQTRQQYNEAGPGGMVWTLTVWRVTIIQQARPQTDLALRSKST